MNQHSQKQFSHKNRRRADLQNFMSEFSFFFCRKLSYNHSKYCIFFRFWVLKDWIFLVATTYKYKAKICTQTQRMKKKKCDHRPRNSAQYERVVELLIMHKAAEVSFDNACAPFLRQRFEKNGDGRRSYERFEREERPKKNTKSCGYSFLQFEKKISQGLWEIIFSA